MNVRIRYPKHAICFFMAAFIFASAFGQDGKWVRTEPPTAAADKITLKIGDAAPAIKFARWLKGTPVTSFDKNKMYVVELGGTWCSPCVAEIPHISELAKKYAGKVTFGSFFIMEKSSEPYDETLDRVARFVKAKGDTISYNVGIDTEDGFMCKNWYKEATGRNGLPVSYIVQNNKVIWIDHPNLLDSMLEVVLSGEFNLQAAITANNKLLADEVRTAELLKSWKAALADATTTKDAAKLFTAFEKIGPDLPSVRREMVRAEMLKSLVGIEKNSPLLVDDIKRWYAMDPSMNAAFSVASLANTDSSLSPDFYRFALECAKKVLSDFSEHKDKIPHVYMSRVYMLVADCYRRLDNIPEADVYRQKAQEAAAKKADGVGFDGIEHRSLDKN